MPALVKREVAEDIPLPIIRFRIQPELAPMSEKAGQEEIIKGFEANDRAAYGTASGARRCRFSGFRALPTRQSS